MKQILKIAAAIVAWGAGIPAVTACGIMVLWNQLLTALCGFTVIGFWQAVGIFLLGQLITGGFIIGLFVLGGLIHKAGHKHHHRGHWHEMTDEQRREFFDRRREWLDMMRNHRTSKSQPIDQPDDAE